MALVIACIAIARQGERMKYKLLAGKKSAAALTACSSIASQIDAQQSSRREFPFSIHSDFIVSFHASTTPAIRRIARGGTTTYDLVSRFFPGWLE